jgi:hypothetical protein
MPIEIPRYQSEVNPAGGALPGIRVPVEAPVEAFGGGQAVQSAFGAASGLGAEAEKLAAEEKKKADDLATQEAFAKTVELKNRLMYDPNQGAILRRGKDALGVADEYGTQFDKEADKINESLANDDQREIYHKIRLQQRSDFTGDLERHTAQEYQAYQGEVFTSSMKAAHDDAVLSADDPAKFDEKLRLQDALIVSHAARQGKDGAWVRAQIEDARGKTYTGVMESLLRQRKDAEAQDFWKIHKEDVKDAESRVKIEEGMGQISALNKAQFLAQTIIGKTQDPLEQYNLSIKYTEKDPRAQDKVQELLREYNTAQKAQQDLGNKLAAENVWKQLQSGAKWDDVPMPDKLKLSETDTVKFISFDKNRHNLETQKTSPKEFDRLMKLADANPQGFLKEDINTNPLLTEQDRGRALTIWKGVNEKDDRAKKEVSGWAQQDKIMDDALRSGRIFDHDEMGKIKAQIRERFADIHTNNPKVDTIKDFESTAKKMVDDAVLSGLIHRTQPKPPKQPAAPTFNEGTVNAVAHEKAVDKKKVDVIRDAVRQFWSIETARTKRNMSEDDLAKITALMATPVSIEVDWWPDSKKLAGELTLKDAPKGYIDNLKKDMASRGQPTDDQAVLTIFRMKAAGLGKFKGNRPWEK